MELINSHHDECTSHQHNISKLTAVTVGSVMHSIHCYSNFTKINGMKTVFLYFSLLNSYLPVPEPY